ncbi:histidinol-phosphate transaminase [Candidatus Pacearchaeota archaeon]|nr:MAG: histidinol-phosphate transaminase [Candidatus Pacearchaeota archaeon]
MKIKSYLKNLTPYPPGKTLEELRRELKISGPIYKFNSNENPLGPSPKVIEIIKKHLPEIHLYPDASYIELRKAIAKIWNVLPEQIIVGNGSDEVIEFVFKAMINPGDEIIISKPSFLMYKIFGEIYGADIKYIPLNRNLQHNLKKILQNISSKTKVIFLDHPHNPTGSAIKREMWGEFFSQIDSEILVVIDEAYGDFIDDKDIPLGIEFLKKGYTVLILRTFSKAYGLAGLRLGYGITFLEFAKVLDSVRQAFNINILAVKAGLAVLNDKEYIQKTIEIVKKGRVYLTQKLKELGIKVFPSQANFVMADFGEKAEEIYNQLLKQGILVRPLKAYGYPNYLRISIGLPEENEVLIKKLKSLLSKDL